MKKETAIKEFVKCFMGISYRFNRYDLFRDFCSIAALALRQQLEFDEDRENEYKKICARYPKKVTGEFSTLLGLVIAGLHDDMTDFLGVCFEQLELTNQYAGQFFTPPSVATVLGELTVGDSIHDIIKEKGYAMVAEPAAGAGGMILSFAKAAREKGVDFQKGILFDAWDIDRRCAEMCYIQMALCGLAGRVVWGDTLRMTVSDVWYTPMFYMGAFPMRGAMKF